jgi:hypothetical protein
VAISLDDYEVGKRIVALLKGPPKTGKSIAACSFATKERPMYIFDIDQRMESVVSFYRRYDPERLKYIFYDTYYTYQSIVDKLDALMEMNRMPYGNILVDSLTPLARMILTEMIEVRVDEAKTDRGKKVNKSGNIAVNQVEDFNGETAGLSFVLAALRSNKFAGCNVFLNAHVVEISQFNLRDQTTRTSRRLLTGGKGIAAEIPSYFNEIWHFSCIPDVSGRPEYKCMIRPSNMDEFNDFAGTSIQELPDSIIWTDKLFNLEIEKYMPVLKGSGLE